MKKGKGMEQRLTLITMKVESYPKNFLRYLLVILHSGALLKIHSN